NKEKTREEHRQTDRCGPKLDRPSNEIGDDLADHDKNDAKHEQFHSEIRRSIPCGSPRKPPTLSLILPTRTRRLPIKMISAPGPPHPLIPNLPATHIS